MKRVTFSINDERYDADSSVTDEDEADSSSCDEGEDKAEDGHDEAVELLGRRLEVM